MTRPVPRAATTRPVPPEYANWTPEETPRGVVYVSPDGMQAYSQIRNRVYTRRFNHAVARELYAAGVVPRQIAQQLGATEQAILLAVLGVEYQAAYQNRSNAYTMRGVCELCGGPCVGPGHRRTVDDRILCKTCRNGTRRTEIRYDLDGVKVRCALCRHWFPGDDFGYGGRYRDVREGGYAQSCTACSTAARNDYRNRHKVPCEGGCGTMVEGRGRFSRPGQDPNRPYLCMRCWHSRRWEAA